MACSLRHRLLSRLLLLFFALLFVHTVILSGFSDISDAEIQIPNYNILRCDRSRHGGGILYVKPSLHAPFIPTSVSIELLLFTIKVRHRTFTIGTFYRPSSSPHTVDLQEALLSFGPSLLLNLVLLGDFNIDYSDVHSPLLHKLNIISDSLDLKQIVKEPTHFSPSGTQSTIDLVFVHAIHSCSTLLFCSTSYLIL